MAHPRTATTKTWYWSRGDHSEDFILVIIIIKPHGSYTDSIYIVVNWDVIVGKAT